MKRTMRLLVAGSLLAFSALYAAEVVNINAKSSDVKRITKEDLGNKKAITEESFGLRKTDLYTEAKDTVGEKTDYKRAAAGTAQRFERAFVNAPPMIPHDIEGMLPIKANNNICLTCHMPELAKNIPNAVAIPATHFTSFRPATTIAADGKISKDGKGVDNTSDFLTVAHKGSKLNQARFNCSQCHAPQSKMEPIVGNTFTPDFGDGKLKSKSNLIDVMNEGVQ